MDAEKYLQPSVIDQVARLDLKARFIVEGFLSGLHSSPYHGFSMEFSEHKKYAPGDDIQGIDWAVYAKTDRYYIKKYEAENNLQCHILMDQSLSMGYRYAREGPTKLNYSIYLAAALAYLMIGQRDPVGLITFDEQIQNYIPPRSKQSHLVHLLEMLDQITPSNQTGIGSSLHQIADMIPHKGLVILFSDLLEDISSIMTGLCHLRFKGHDMIVFQVLDTAEVEFPFGGPSQFCEPETGEKLELDARQVKEWYLKRITQFRDELSKKMSEIRVDFLSLDTSIPFDKALISFLLRRKSRF